MAAPSPHPTQLSTRLAAALAARLVLQILVIGLRGLLFAGAHRALPATIRLRSPGVVACSAMFFVAAWLRHGLAGHEPAAQVLFGAGLVYAALMIVSLSQRMAEFALCLCITIAADLLAAAAALLGGVSLADTMPRDVLLAWPLAAILVALVQLRLARPVRTPRPAEWPSPPHSPSKD
jgi:uncharacterized membrane protein